MEKLNLDDTEQCINAVIVETSAPLREKIRLVYHYLPVISEAAAIHFLRIIVLMWEIRILIQDGRI